MILVLAGYLATRRLGLTVGALSLQLDGWQLCFVVPAAMAMVTVLFLINRLWAPRPWGSRAWRRT